MPRSCRAMPRNVGVSRDTTGAITAGRVGCDRRVNRPLNGLLIRWSGSQNAGPDHWRGASRALFQDGHVSEMSESGL